MTAASVQGWDYPISQETIVLADIFDLEHYINADPKKPRPKPHAIRPFKTDNRATEAFGKTGGRTPEQVRAILEQARLGLATT